jgi:hypothetical protein
MYKLYPNYATIIEQNIDQLLTSRFIQSVDEAIWLCEPWIIAQQLVKL